MLKKIKKKQTGKEYVGSCFFSCSANSNSSVKCNVSRESSMQVQKLLTRNFKETGQITKDICICRISRNAITQTIKTLHEMLQLNCYTSTDREI